MNENYFESADLSLIATLVALGYNLDGIDRNNSSRAILYIKRDKQLDEIVQAFWAHSLKVDPLTYFNCLKEIKTRIYNS